jgi:uncharacterized protein with FMN-binding domain
MRRLFWVLALAAACLAASGCVFTADVRVTVQGGRITDLKLVKHSLKKGL